MNDSNDGQSISAIPTLKSLRLDQQTKIRIEENYPGILGQIERFEKADLPLCLHCGSDDTASVQVGVNGRTMTIATFTSKFKLVLNVEDKKGKYFCNKCGSYFD